MLEWLFRSRGRRTQSSWELIGYSYQYGRSVGRIPGWVMEQGVDVAERDCSLEARRLHLTGRFYRYRVDYETAQVRSGENVRLWRVYRRPRRN